MPIMDEKPLLYNIHGFLHSEAMGYVCKYIFNWQTYLLICLISNMYITL